MNEASLLAARKNKKAITKDELEEASIKVVAGPEKSLRSSQRTKRSLPLITRAVMHSAHTTANHRIKFIRYLSYLEVRLAVSQ